MGAALALATLGAIAIPSVAAETGEPPYEQLTGTYVLEDGRLLIIWDVVDQMPQNAHQLVVTEPASGWVRSLHPDDTSPFRFSAGPGWFVPTPREATLTFDQHDSKPAHSVQWTLEGDVAVGERAPLRRRSLSIESGDVVLAGELVLPPESVAQPPYPGLLMIPGFGPLTRNTPRYVADQYAMAGIAVLIHDKRGAGESTGRWVPGAVPDFARDAEAALAVLREQPDVDPGRVGVMASSLGGMTAALLHEKDPDWAFFVCRVCPTVPHWETKLASIPQQGRAAGLPPGEILDALARQVLADRYAVTRENYEALASVEETTRTDEWRNRIGHPSDWPPVMPAESSAWDGYAAVLGADPQQLYRNIQAPLLVILGEYDHELPGHYHASRLRWALEQSGHQHHEIRVLPKASHGLMETEFDESGQRRPFRRFVPGWHQAMVEWVVQQVGDVSAGD
ncbi:MAG: alpha/beta hydrolase [Xanthomonadales bacterium]|nr:alpha/beta hydrolase [Xanthomonadales bacterium]